MTSTQQDDRPPVPVEEAEPVTLGDAAARLGWPRSALLKRDERGQLPQHRWTVGGDRAWHLPDLAAALPEYRPRPRRRAADDRA